MVRASHLRKSHVADYVTDNGERKVELDAADNVTLASLLSTRLKDLVDAKVIGDSLKESGASVKRWREHYGFRGR